MQYAAPASVAQLVEDQKVAGSILNWGACEKETNQCFFLISMYLSVSLSPLPLPQKQ